MNKEYIIALKDSLIKKCRILDEIYDMGLIQSKMLASDELDYGEFNELVENRDLALDNIDKIDEGFEILYERARQDMQANMDIYSEDIKNMKESIKYITDKVTAINALDSRNKSALENVLLRDRRNIQESKRSVSVAMNYYKNMNGLGAGDNSIYFNKKN